ncbi:MAG TPA: hypothetical protein PLL69_00190 [Gemmatimonadales bacterium]|nr:hypothetical protein [Gemmatimonadales bacterium]
MPVVQLGPPEATHAHGFTNLGSVYETADGNVIVADSPDEGLFALGKNLDQMHMVGSFGSGPQEYQNSVGTMQFADDSAMQIDGLARRWLILAGDSIVAQFPADSLSFAARSHITGADSLGNVLIQAIERATPSGTTVDPADSVWLILCSRRTGSVDTVSRLRPLPPSPPGKTVTPAEYWYAEQAFLSLDGWLAVLRLEPYRIDWRAPDGKWTLGAPIGREMPILDDAEKEHLLARSGTRVGADFRERINWPDRIPPVGFQFPSRTTTRDGMLVVSRQRTRTVPDGLYDVIDRTGRLVRQVQLDPGQRIIGFGKGSVYVVSEDDDGLQFLSRHGW